MHGPRYNTTGSQLSWGRLDWLQPRSGCVGGGASLRSGSVCESTPCGQDLALLTAESALTHSLSDTMAATMACYPGFEPQPAAARSAAPAPAPPKDYSKPQHVDCSVEYELPNQARPPGKSEPLLMIHPCFYRRAESQRRSPFINNLPQPQQPPARRTRGSTALLQQQQQRFQQQAPPPPPPQALWDPFGAQHQMVPAASTACWPPTLEQPPLYCKPPASRRRSSRRTKQPPPQPQQAPDYANVGSSADSGIGGVLSWTDTSPIVMQAVPQQDPMHLQEEKMTATGESRVFLFCPRTCACFAIIRDHMFGIYIFAFVPDPLSRSYFSM